MKPLDNRDVILLAVTPVMLSSNWCEVDDLSVQSTQSGLVLCWFFLDCCHNDGFVKCRPRAES
jgi:hypothetical protein